MQEITDCGIPKADFPYWVLKSTVFPLSNLEFKCWEKKLWSDKSQQKYLLGVTPSSAGSLTNTKALSYLKKSRKQIVKHRDVLKLEPHI